MKLKTEKQLARLAAKAGRGDQKAAMTLMKYMAKPKVVIPPARRQPVNVIIPLNHRRLNDEQIWHNGTHEITPQHLIETLNFASQEINYSNYDCGNLGRLKEILLRFCEQNNIPLGEPVVHRS